jgi:hypothetical protein
MAGMGIRIRIDAVELPGLGTGEWSDIHVAVQRRDRPAELLDPRPGDAASATWTLECTTVVAPHGTDVRGPYVQGRPGTMFRRAELMLDAVPAETLDAPHAPACWSDASA